jgi:hypothetical protein
VDARRGDITRRTLLAGASGLAAGAAATSSAGAAAVTTVGVAGHGRPSVEVIGSIVQDGAQLTGFGYLTHIAGVRDRALFAGSGRDEHAARFTFHSTATVTGRSVRPNLFAVIATGTLTLFHHPAAGANFATPDSFAAGTSIARFDARYENVLTVIAPDHALATVTGALHQRAARGFTAGGRRMHLGRRGRFYRLEVTGPGTRTDPTVPRALFDVAGGLLLAS